MFQTLLKKRLFSLGIGTYRLGEFNQLIKLIELVRSNLVTVELMRVGNEADGGYLVPTLVSDLEYCFSPGVSDSVEFEKQLAKDYAIKTFLIDASIDELPEQNQWFSFSRKFLGSSTDKDFISLSSWIAESVGDNHFKGILQMDIEAVNMMCLLLKVPKRSVNLLF